MERRTIATFDFDGTLTSKDTFKEFIKFTHTRISYYIGVILCIPFIIAYKCKLVPNYVAKQKIFSYFYKGMRYEDFTEYGKKFASEIDKFTREDIVRILISHKKQGHTVYVISAGGIEWIEHWCVQHGVDKVIATLSEVDSNGCLTGRFRSKNCYGKEKVIRFLDQEPNRSEYTLYSYGDSAGDKEIITLADYGQLV